VSADDAQHWTANGWTLANDGGGGALLTQESFEDFELIADWRWTGEAAEWPDDVDVPMTARARAKIRPFQGDGVHPAGQWNRVHITRRGDRIVSERDGQTVVDMVISDTAGPSAPIALLPAGAPVQFANIYVRRLP
jgi:hypothetical protein